MQYQRLINEILSDEGIKLNSEGKAYPYLDTVGVWTIGHGTTYVETPNGIERVTGQWKPITQRLARKWMLANIDDAVTQAKQFVNNFNQLGDLKQEALVNMGYQLGSRLQQFKKTRHYIENQLWGFVYNELLNSKWAKQTPSRAQRVASAFLI